MPTTPISLEGRSLSLRDNKELTAQRGFSEISLQRLGYFTATDADLPALGVTVLFSQLPSTIGIPYLRERKPEGCLCRIHKCSAEGAVYPPYITPDPENPNPAIVFAESELKAGTVFQLGDLGVGLQGSSSFLNRNPELANAIRSRALKGAPVFVLPDLEFTINNGKQEPHKATAQMIQIARGLALDLGVPVKIISLPERFLQSGVTGSGEPKVKADLDGCVAAGLTTSEWQELKATARLPQDLPYPLPFLVRPLAAADLEEFLAGDLLKDRLATASTPETVSTCNALAEVLKAKSFDRARGAFDRNQFDAYAHKAASWAKANGLRGISVRTFSRTVAFDPTRSADGKPLLACCLTEDPDGVKLCRRGQPQELVAPFRLANCSYGFVGFPGAVPARMYRVRIETCLDGKRVKQELTIHGDLYNSDSYTRACVDLAVGDPRHFKMYVSEKLREPGFQQHDPALDMPLFVGLLRNKDELQALNVIDFPRGELDCWYHKTSFSPDGDQDQSFQEIARITPCADVVFAHALGAPLKAILEFYPHCAVVGRRKSAKTFVAKAIAKRTGLAYVSAKKQLGTQYRQMRLLGNHNMAVLADEIQRLDGIASSAFLEALNVAYNGSGSTHGVDGYYFLSGCAVLLGQDHPVADEALLAKIVLVRFALPDLNRDGLRNALKSVTPFPVGAWLQFLQKNATKAQELLLAKELVLIQRLTEAKVVVEEGDRTVLNYAALLVCEEYLRAFGVKIGIEEKVFELLRLHMEGKLHAADENPRINASAERFVRDLLTALTLSRTRHDLAGSFDITDDGVWFQVTPWLTYLKEQPGNNYDEVHPARMGESISEDLRPRGMDQKSHLLGHHRGMAWLIPKSLCLDWGFDFAVNKHDNEADQVT